MRILWLKTELLHPVDKGGKIRTYNMLKELKRAQHHVTYLTLVDESATPETRAQASEYCDELVCIPHRQTEKFSRGFYAELMFNVISTLPYAISKYQSAEMREQIADRVQAGDFDILISDFLTPAVNLPRSLPITTLLFQHNVEAMIWKRHYEVQTNALKKAYLYTQWLKMKRFERDACRRFDRVVAVSADDAETMRREYELVGVADVPTGVDTDFFRPAGAVSPEPHSLVFTGSMDWLPNEDAIRFFTSSILPLVKKSLPDVKLTVVGRNPYPGLVELSKSEPSIEVTGRVEDVRPYMEKAAAYVVPLRIGGGTRLKIYEAMAMERPIVSTSIGAEGLPVENGKELLLADTPEHFAEEVVRVLTNKQLATDIGQSAAHRVREDFGWSSVAEQFAQLCEQAMRSSSQPAKVVTTNETEPVLK